MVTYGLENLTPFRFSSIGYLLLSYVFLLSFDLTMSALKGLIYFFQKLLYFLYRMVIGGFQRSD